MDEISKTVDEFTRHFYVSVTESVAEEISAPCNRYSTGRRHNEKQSMTFKKPSEQSQLQIEQAPCSPMKKIQK